MKELWKVQSEVSRIRGNVRELLSGGSESEEVKEKIIGRLTRLGVANQSTSLDNLLDLKENDLLNRRLQTIVFRKGMARTIRQARQLTVHGFIAINGRKVNRPGYLVDADCGKTDKLLQTDRHSAAEARHTQAACNRAAVQGPPKRG